MMSANAVQFRMTSIPVTNPRVFITSEIDPKWEERLHRVIFSKRAAILSRFRTFPEWRCINRVGIVQVG